VVAASGVPDMASGIMNYLGAIQANKNARAINATNDKWGPMLALNTKGGGAKNVDVPKASFAKIMGPAISAAYNDSAGGGGGGAAEQMAPVGDSSGFSAIGSPMAGGQGEAAGGMGDMASMGAMFAAGGGKVPHYDGGGQQGGGGIGSIIQTGMKLLPLIAMALNKGGSVPGKAPFPGDNPKNDNHLAVLSSGETVLPRSVSQAGMKGNNWKVAQYMQAVKKHGPGPMPVKSSSQSTTGSSQMKPMSKSMSPWQAMAKGGKMGAK
jgi:hypothetical protein